MKSSLIAGTAFAGKEFAAAKLAGMATTGVVAALLLAVSVSIVSCSGVSMVETGAYGQAGEAQLTRGLEVLAQKKVFFGHQSVGLDILQGVRDLAASGGRALPHIAEARSVSALGGPGLYHAAVGSNMDPLGKLRDFDGIMRSGMAGAVELAVFKFCYVDIDRNSDVSSLFGAYRETMRKLKADYPDLVVVHCAVPLTRREGGMRNAVKRLLGGTVESDADNAAREAFNRLMRSEYQGKEAFFDLALAEAADSSGAATLYGSGRATHYALRPEYTHDGGHLNEAGRARVAGLLLVCLDQAATRR